MKTLKLSDSACNILEKLASRSGMDEWFRIAEDNTAAAEDVRTLCEGLTDHDVETLSPQEIITLLEIQAYALR